MPGEGGCLHLSLLVTLCQTPLETLFVVHSQSVSSNKRTGCLPTHCSQLCRCRFYVLCLPLLIKSRPQTLTEAVSHVFSFYPYR